MVTSRSVKSTSLSSLGDLQRPCSERGTPTLSCPQSLNRDPAIIDDSAHCEVPDEDDLAYWEMMESTAAECQSYRQPRRPKYPIIVRGNLQPLADYHDEQLQFLNQEIIFLREELVTEDDGIERQAIKRLILEYEAQRTELVEESNRAARNHTRAQKTSDRGRRSQRQTTQKQSCRDQLRKVQENFIIDTLTED